MKFSVFYSLERDDAALMGHGYVYEMRNFHGTWLKKNDIGKVKIKQIQMRYLSITTSVYT